MGEKAGIFSAKVWVLSVIFSPVILVLAIAINERRWQLLMLLLNLKFYFVIFFAGIISSLPALGLFSVANWWLFSSLRNKTTIRIYSSVIAALICITTFALIFDQDGDWLEMSGCSIISLLLGIWYFRVENEA